MGINNIILTNFFTFFDGLAMGMWSYAILGPYLYSLCGDNTHAGYTESVQSALQFVAAITAGVLADKYRRDSVLKLSAFIGLVGIFITLAGLYKFFDDWWSNYLLLSAGLGVMGLYMGAWQPPLYAIYADSMASGHRSRYETCRFILSIASQASGPITNIILFTYMGDRWGMKKMTTIFAAGIALHVISLVSLAFFNDDNTVSESKAFVSEDTTEEEDDEAVLLRLEAVETNRSWMFTWLHGSMVPVIVGASDVMFGLASGMTIKFFPIYFAKQIHLTPIVVNVIFVLDPVIEVIISLLGQRLSVRVGRVEICLLFKGIGIALLFVMAMFPTFLQQHPYILAATYLARTSMINSVVPLTHSILMDYVPSKKRGVWNTLESVTGFGWAGTAALGGIIIDSYGYETSFAITAMLQCVAWLPLILLLPLVIREDQFQLNPEDQASARRISAANAKGYDSIS